MSTRSRQGLSRRTGGDEDGIEAAIEVGRRSQANPISLNSPNRRPSLTIPTKMADENVVRPAAPIRQEKCEQFKRAMQNSGWAQKGAFDSVEEAEYFNKTLKSHIESKCNCVSKPNVQLLMGVASIELFIFKLREFGMKVDEEEEKLRTTQPESDEDDSEEGSTNKDGHKASTKSSDDKQSSKFDGAIFPHLTNWSECASLLEHLRNAIDNWYAAIKSGEESLQPGIIQKLRLPQNLATAFYACSCYNIVEYQWKVCRTYMLLHKSKHKPLLPHNSIQAHYFQARTYLDYGLLQHALYSLSKIEDMCQNAVNSDCFEARQVQLLKIEIDIWLGKQNEASKELKSLLDSDYLKKLTLNRYLLKIQALLLANKFYGFEYQFETNLKEFIEPLQMSVSVLKRWFKPCFRDKNEKVEKVDKGLNAENDPMWYRFAWIECGFRSLLIAGEFQLNIGMPHDLVYPYNGMIKIARQLSNVYWMTKLLNLGSRIDHICDKFIPCNSKLKNASQLLLIDEDQSSAHHTNGTSHLLSLMDNLNINDEQKRHENADSGDTTITIIDSPRNMSRRDPPEVECGHNQSTQLFNMKRRLQKLTLHDESDEHLLDVSSTLPLCRSNIPHPFAELLAIEVSLYQVSFSTCKNKVPRYKQLITRFSKALGRLIEKIKALLSVPKMPHNFGPLVGLNFSIHLHLVRSLYLSKNYLDILSVCDPFIFVDDKFDRFVRVFDFEQRTSLVFLIAYYVGAKHNLNNAQDKNLWTDINLHDPKLNESRRNETLDKSTSTPPRKARNVPPPVKAPKGGTKYKMSPLQDYVTALSKHLEKSDQKRKGPSSRGLFDDYVESPEDQPLVQSRLEEAYHDINTLDSSMKKNRVSPSKLNTSSRVRSNQSRSQPKEQAGHGEGSNLDEIIDPSHADPSQSHSSPPIDASKLKVFLLTAMKMMDGHPPCQFYRLIQEQLWKIDSHRDRSSSCLYFSEFLSNPSFRYRCHQVSARKGKRVEDWSIDLEFLKFDYKFFRADPLKSLLSRVPQEWRIVQIYADTSSKIPDLYVCRYQNGQPPVTMKLRGDPCKFTRDFMTELEEIIELSNGSIVNRDSKTFWKVRYALDDRLSLLLKGVERAWFGPFRGILLGKPPSHEFDVACRIVKKKIMTETEKLNAKILNAPLLEVLIESAPLLEATEFSKGLSILIEGKVEPSFLRACYKIWLKEIEKVCPMDDKSTIYSDSTLTHVGLVLDKHLLGFPFESLPFLTKIQQPFFRVPSLNYVAAVLNGTKENSIFNQGANEDKAYYVINPADNLAKTEEYFKEALRARQSWRGAISHPPDPIDLRDALQDKDIYIFFGHGAGSPYYRKIPDTIDSLSLRAASVVIGCCSAKMPSDGKELEPWGVSTRFLANGAPAYLGILWDVTDKDIDRFSDRFMECWLSEWRDSKNKKPLDMLNAVAQSRDACRLKNLIGASAVVYGLPISTRKLPIS